jgi:hypothetical protein
MKIDKKISILMRRVHDDEEEITTAKKYFDVVEQRSQIPYNRIVVGRYAVLPYYKELELDLPTSSKLINSYVQHKYVADLSNWYYDLKDLTPMTWFSLMDFKTEYHRQDCDSYVLKGLTNSRKFLWRTHMFAATEKDVEDVYCRLMDDTMISEQGICIRRFIPFKNYGKDIHGMPITKEFRVFILNAQVLAKGFYWSNHIDNIEEKISTEDIPEEFLQEVIQKVKGKINFYTVDVAQDINGKWWVVELNDGQMAGLSCIDLDEFYSNMKRILR